jgi:hypothetical protein
MGEGVALRSNRRRDGTARVCPDIHCGASSPHVWRRCLNARANSLAAKATEL